MKLKNGKKPPLDGFRKLNVDVKTLRDLALTSLFVAFDLEFSGNTGDSASRNIIEAGLAFSQLDANHCLQPIPQNSNLETFFEQNQIKAYSIRSIEVPEKKATRESLKFGTKLLINSSEFNSTIIELLSTSITLLPRKHVVLVGWSMIAELEWIAHNCPQFMSYLTAWADLQDLVISKDPPSLLRTLQAIGVADHDPDSKNRSHRAANDAVRCLAVLFRLFTESIHIPQTVAQYSRIPALPKGPPPGIPRTAQPKYPFGVYVYAAGGSPLPAICHTPNSLHHKFSSYNLRAVGLDRKEIRENGFCKCWWLAFQTLEGLNRFVADHNGASIQGIPLSIQVVNYS
jgi:hypothetical protein